MNKQPTNKQTIEFGPKVVCAGWSATVLSAVLVFFITNRPGIALLTGAFVVSILGFVTEVIEDVLAYTHNNKSSEDEQEETDQSESPS